MRREAAARQAREADLPAVSAIYENIHSAEEAGRLVIGWRRGVYPTLDTAAEALGAGELYVLDDPADGGVCAAAIINRRQPDAYRGAPWRHEAQEREVMVLHTLVVDPHKSGRGRGRAMLDFYAEHALENGCPWLRMDTNARNIAARSIYKKLGFEEIGSVSTLFNGLPEVELVLLERPALWPAPSARPGAMPGREKTDAHARF